MTGPSIVVELQALASSVGVGVWLSVAVAAVAALFAYPAARSIPTPILVGLALVSGQVRAFGVLAVGLQPGLTASFVALSAGAVPMAALVISLRLSHRPGIWLDAASDLGAGAAATVRWVEWPYLRPAFAVALGWTVLQVLGDTTVTALAGGGLSYGPGLLAADAIVRDGAVGRAAVVVVIVVVIAAAVSAAVARELWARRPGARAHDERPAVIVQVLGLGALGWVMIPLLGLVGWWWGPSTERSHALLLDLLPQTSWIALVIGTIAGLAGLVLAYATRRRRAWGFTTLLLTPLAVPPGVAGLSALLLGGLVGVRPSDALTIVALLPAALGVGFVACRLRLATIPDALFEAAADLGASRWRIFRRVGWPLARGAAVTGGLVAAAWAVGEPAIVAFTSGPGGSTLSVGMTVASRAGDIGDLARWGLVVSLGPVLAGVGIAIWAGVRGRSRS